MSGRNILVVGSANIDLVTCVPRSPKPGETLIGRSFMTVMGGKGANQAVAAARLGAQVSFAGCVGDDAFGGQQRQSLAADGIDLRYLKTHPSEPTGTAIILVVDEGQNSIVVTPSANNGILPEDIAGMTALFETADAVLLQFEIPVETVEAALDMARRCGTLSVLDTGSAQSLPPGLIAKADIVSPNEIEAEALTGIRVDSVTDAGRAAEKLLEMGARHAVMKLGAHGSLYLGKDRVYVPAFKVTPVDTTAAGDAFTAALAVAWKDRPIREALRFANAAGALATTVAGAQPSMPDRAAVEAFLKNNPDVEG